MYKKDLIGAAIFFLIFGMLFIGVPTDDGLMFGYFWKLALYSLGV